MRSSRINKDIRSKKVFLIEEGKMTDSIDFYIALNKAVESGLDLVEVGSKDDLPLCKIMDYGKYKYEKIKREKKNRKPKLQLKEVKFRPNISDNDLIYRAKQVCEFLKEGHKVKLVIRFVGREQEHKFETGKNLFEKFFNLIKTKFTLDSFIDSKGRQMYVTISPSK